MKHLGRRLLALALSVAMAATMAPPVSAQAASKKTVTVSTQAGLTQALQTKGVTKIIVKTTKAVKFTVKEGKYSAKLDVNAPKATMTNNGTWSAVTVTDAKAYTEKAKNNKIVVKDKKLTFTVAKGASVKSVTFAKKGASDTVKINGKVSAITISAPSTIKITDNGSLKKLTVDAKAKLTLSGSSDTKTAVTLTKNAANSTLKSAVPVTLKTSAAAAITLSKGAEGSAVTVKSADAKVTLTNNTKKVITVTKADGEKETVKAGEKASTDASDDSTTKDETQKEDDKKPAAGGGGGGGTSTGSGDTPSTPTDTNSSLTLSKTEVTISQWDGPQTIAVTARNVGKVEWTSSKEDVVTVSGTNTAGTLNPQAAGEATITVSGGGLQRECVVTVSADETKTATGLQNAVAALTDNTSKTISLSGDIADSVSLEYNGTGTLTINFKNYTVNGNVTITSSKTNYIYLTDTNATITGDLTVNAPKSHVENSVTARNVVIHAVSESTFVLKDVIKGILQMAGKGTVKVEDISKNQAPSIVVDTTENVKLAGNVKNVEVTKPANITVATTVEKIEVKPNAATAENKVTISAIGEGKATAIQADAPVEVAVPTTEIVASQPVDIKTDVTSVYVTSDEATVKVDSGKTVDNIAVADSSVKNISVTGEGSVGAIDVTNASSNTVSVSVGTSATEATKIPVVTKTDQTISGDADKVTPKTVTKVEVNGGVKSQEIAKGSQPDISGNITVTYSDSSTGIVAVTEQMTFLQSDQPGADGYYVIWVTYGGCKCEFYKYKYKEPTIDSAVFDGSAMKTTYKRGETFDPSGAVVTLTYDNGDVKKLTDTSCMVFSKQGVWGEKGTYGVNVSQILVEGITYSASITGEVQITVNSNYYTVDLNLNENGRKVSLPRVEEGTMLSELTETKDLITLQPEYPGHSYWTFNRWVTVADRTKVYDFTTPITGNVNLIAEWNTTPPDGKQGITEVIQQTTGRNSQSILQVFTTGNKDVLNDTDFVVEYSKDNGASWKMVDPSAYTGFTDEYISWYGIQFKDQSMFFKTPTGEEATYAGAIFKVSAANDGKLAGYGTCTIVSLVDTFGPSVRITGFGLNVKDGVHEYDIVLSTNEKTTYSYLGVSGDRRAQGNISKDAYDSLQSEAIVSGSALEGPTEQGAYSYSGRLSFTTTEQIPAEGMTVYYLFWDKYNNYTEAIPVYYSKGSSGTTIPNVRMGFSLNSVTCSAITNETGLVTGKNVSATVQVTSSLNGTYSWLVSNEDLGEQLSLSEYDTYVQECKSGNTSRIIKLIQQGESIQADQQTDVQVTFEIPADANGTYYIYLIVFSSGGGSSPAKGNNHAITFSGGEIAYPNTNS